MEATTQEVVKEANAAEEEAEEKPPSARGQREGLRQHRRQRGAEATPSVED